MSKKIKIILTVSVVLNVLLIGVLVGMSADEYKDHRNKRAEFRSAVDKLPPEKSKLVKKTMRGLHKETRKTRNELKKTRKKINKIISAPEFDESAYDVEIENLKRLQSEIMTKFGQVTKELAAQLGQEERKVIAELLKKRTFKKHGHDGIKPPPGLDQPPPF